MLFLNQLSTTLLWYSTILVKTLQELRKYCGTWVLNIRKNSTFGLRFRHHLQRHIKKNAPLVDAEKMS